MNTQVTFYVGTGFDKSHTAISGARLAVMQGVAESRLADSFEGFTSFQTSGGWRDGSGELIREPGLMFVVLTESTPSKTAERAQAMADSLCDIFNQSAVLFTISKPEFVGISQGTD